MEFREVDERIKMQFDYAWKWFESHQRQRMVMFYYYCIMVGILANALVASYKGSNFKLVIPIGIMGAVVSFASLFFDLRNRGMCKVAEDILEKLENEVVFPTNFLDKNDNKMGPISVDHRIGMREGLKLPMERLVQKHKFWIRLMEIIAGSYFLAIVIWEVVKWIKTMKTG